VSRPILWPTQAPIHRTQKALYPVVKGPGREADHSPPSSAEVKNAWSCTSTHPYVFMVLYLHVLESRDNSKGHISPN
jgi:hypothetical protein